jgi:hypothetical protein
MKNSNEYFTLSKTSLRDKILGAWAGKSYGAMMGEPMELDARERYTRAVLIYTRMLQKYGYTMKMIYIRNISRNAIFVYKSSSLCNHIFGASGCISRLPSYISPWHPIPLAHPSWHHKIFLPRHLKFYLSMKSLIM